MKFGKEKLFIIFFAIIIFLLFAMTIMSNSNNSNSNNSTREIEYCQLYFDFSFDENLFLAKYDLQFYLDDKLIATIAHGKNYSNLINISKGSHELVFYKDTDKKVKATKEISIWEDSTLKGNLHTNNSNIELNDFEMVASIDGAALRMIDVTFLSLDVAKTKLEQIGFANVCEEPYYDIWESANWTVVSQSVGADSCVDKNTEIVLQCKKTTEFLEDKFNGFSIMEAENKVVSMQKEYKFIDYLTNTDMTEKVNTMEDEEKRLWNVKKTSYNSSVISFFVMYFGNTIMPNLIGKTLSDAMVELKNCGFSSIESVSDDGSTIIVTSNWRVVKQNVDAGKETIATDKIMLTVEHISTETNNGDKEPPSNSSDSNDTVYYSSNTKETVKNGNQGVYAYKRSATYDNYFIIDFDEGYVYFFSDGNGSETCDRLKIETGDLNTVLIITYHDGTDKWSYGLHFKYKKQPEHLILQEDDTEYDYYTAELDRALGIKNSKRIIDY